MAVEHPQASVFCAYLEGRLEDASCLELETHVEQCPQCARELQRAASLEELLHQAAARLQTSPRLTASVRHSCSVGAMAAMVLLMISGGTPARSSMERSKTTAGRHEPASVAGICVPDAAGDDDRRCDDPQAAALASYPEDWAEDDAICSSDQEELMCSVDVAYAGDGGS